MSKENSQATEFAESLSALMDNESNELELRRLLKEMPERPEIAETWNRFNLTRSLLHKEDVRRMSAAGTASILSAIAAEAAYAGAEPAAIAVGRKTWVQNFGRMAVAASVALAVFVGMQTALDQGIPESSIADQGTSQSSGQVELVADSSMELASDAGFDAAAQRRLDDYIRSVSIQYREEGPSHPAFNILQDSQLIRQVNQIEN